MELEWKINSTDIQKIKRFVEEQKNNSFVINREFRNLATSKSTIKKEEAWQVLIGCLLSTQQRSGPESYINRFYSLKPFPLSYGVCLNKDDVRNYCFNVLTNFGGIRRTNKIAEEISINLKNLEIGIWNELMVRLNELTTIIDPILERETADYIDNKLHGFGPKQSRNFLQWLGLTRYEIPIDSRITKWLNKFGFPVLLSSTALSDRNYYNFISDGIQRLCSACEIYPCILDAAIFASFDKEGWTSDNVVY